MEPFSAAVIAAVGTVSSGALSGAGGEMGRRSSEALFGLLRRGRRAGASPDGDPSGQPDEGPSAAPDEEPEGEREEDHAAGEPVLPVTEEERRALAVRLLEHARRSPEFAREVAAWVRETEWLEPRAVPALAHGASRPRMLPPATAVFTDREALHAEITGLLDSGERPAGAPAVVVLVGPGGVGKSAAAVHCAHLLSERFPDGQLYTDLAAAGAGPGPGGAAAPSEVLVRFLDRLGVPPSRMPADEQRQSELYRDCVAGRRMVVVLDNAASAAQVAPLLPADSGCLVIVTSRRRLDGLVAVSGARHITLPPLSAADSVRLLGRIVGRERMAGPEAEAGARAVAEKCGRLPLALCATGARFAVREHLTWQAMDRQLSERLTAEDTSGAAGTAGAAGADGGGGGGMDGGAAGGHPPEGEGPPGAVHAATDATYGELSPEAARLYRSTAVWPWPGITVGAAARAAGSGEEEARTGLEELAGVHLLEEVGEERYRFHDLVRRHALRRAEAEDGYAGMAAAVRRTVGWHLGCAAAADLRVIPGRWRLGPAYLRLSLPADRDAADGGAALAELRRERENLAAAVRAAEEYGLDELVWQLCEAMWGLHLRLGYHQQWIDTHRRGVEAARRCAEAFGDPRAEGRMLVQLAFAHLGRGGAEDAGEAEAALVRAAEADGRARHHRGQASAVEALGLLRLKQWRWADAEDCFAEAGRTLGRIGPGDDGANDVPRARALLAHHLGRALRGQGRLEEAERRLHGALEQFRDLAEPDLYNQARVHMSLGETHLDGGDPEFARTCLGQAIATLGNEGAALQHADAAELRARCARQLADADGEAHDLRTALGLYEGADDTVSAARVRARLAELGAED
ncbi:tetratricopeptide repeat protein [Streptomyces armeniacus]|uniref:tetratricopeptide repeat protein n=1 Tax=Streptomyces armeniacus TaxID=83291 RepID=UPI001FE90EE7|nr:tetratricopeptide repeat protein [Streptomyces armeniacus]